MARPRGFDERQVLQAARDEFWSCGYAATSIDDVVAVTGLGKGSLYGAFGDKHALFLRVFDDYCTDAVNAARQSLTGQEQEFTAAWTKITIQDFTALKNNGRRKGSLSAPCQTDGDERFSQSYWY